jgi:DNA modification methylase
LQKYEPSGRIENMELPLNSVINADCLEFMKTLPDKCVDLVLTDPPYGVDIAGKKGGKGGERAKRRNELGCYDDTPESIKTLIENFIPEARRVGKCVIVCAGIKTLMYYPQPDWIMAWVYDNKNLFCPYGFNNWTPILCYGKDPFQQKRKGKAPLAVLPDVIYDNKPAQKNGHPTPKPLSFMAKLLNRVSTSSDDIILDPFAGSGTTCVAAKMEGRNYIGVEISKKYCDIANERLSHVTQKLL